MYGQKELADPSLATSIIKEGDMDKTINRLHNDLDSTAEGLKKTVTALQTGYDIMMCQLKHKPIPKALQGKWDRIVEEDNAKP